MGVASLAVALAVLTLGAAAQPKLAVEPMVLDFGEVAEGWLVIHTFVLRNVGTAELQFPRDPATDCGCTTTGLPIKRLAPGQSVGLVVRFDSTGFGGYSVTKKVYVYSNDPQTPTLTLTLTGRVRKAQAWEGSASDLYGSYFLLVDLRAPEEFAKGRLLGAINIPFKDLATWIPRLSRDHAVYLYDETGTLATQAVQMLRREGFLTAYAVTGGLAQWWRELNGLLFVWSPGVTPTAFQGSSTCGLYCLPPSRVLANYLVVLDFRSKESFAQAALPGAVNLEFQSLESFANSLSPQARASLTVWCLDDDGTTAAQAARLLGTLGFKSAKSVIGGIAQWRFRYGDVLLWPASF